MAQVDVAPIPREVAKLAHPPANTALLLLSTPLVWLAPRTVGRLWARARLWQALLLGVLWITGGTAILNHYLPRPTDMAEAYDGYTAREIAWIRLGSVGGFVGFLVMLGFAILPFVPRPGPSRPVVKHMARTVLLGGSMTLLWWVALLLARWELPHLLPRFDVYDSLMYWLAVGAALVAWTYFALAALRVWTIEAPKMLRLRASPCAMTAAMISAPSPWTAAVRSAANHSSRSWAKPPARRLRGNCARRTSTSR